jgi:hypothetical protein
MELCAKDKGSFIADNNDKQAFLTWKKNQIERTQSVLKRKVGVLCLSICLF